MGSASRHWLYIYSHFESVHKLRAFSLLVLFFFWERSHGAIRAITEDLNTYVFKVLTFSLIVDILRGVQ